MNEISKQLIKNVNIYDSVLPNIYYSKLINTANIAVIIDMFLLVLNIKPIK